MNPDKPGAPWWVSLTKDERVLLGFVKIDRTGSTKEWDEMPAEQVVKRRARYTAGVEEIARAYDAAPLSWQGDGVMLFFKDGGVPAPTRAFQAARALWERVRIDLNLEVRVGVNAAQVQWDPDTGKIADPALDLCGHLEKAAPVNSIAVAEDVYLALPQQERDNTARLGITRRDGVLAFVFPASAAKKKDDLAFLPPDEKNPWDELRRYSLRKGRIRYVGFRTARKEPPDLPIQEVFVDPEVSRHIRRRIPVERGKKGTIKKTPPLSDETDFLPWGREDHSETAVEPFKLTFQRHRALVVLGEPGAGKSTLLRWLAFVAARGPLEMQRVLGIRERLLPLLISVGALAEIRTQEKCRLVLDALGAYFENENLGDAAPLRDFLRERLDRGDCLVLLDGLDEVRGKDREEVRNWLESFAAKYERNRFVVTSRIVGFGGFTAAGSEAVTLQPFTDAQVGEYVRAFCRAYAKWETGVDDALSAERAAMELLGGLKESPRLSLIARNPLVLTGLALIHRAEGRKLPRYRVEFYDVFAQTLCELWGRARRIVATAEEKTISFKGEALPILGDLAVRLHEKWPTGAAPREFVLETLKSSLIKRKGIAKAEAEESAREFLNLAGDEIQILVERGPEEWGFLHLTFQEFFAAAGLHAAGRFEKVAIERLFDPRWEEVIRLGVGYWAIIKRDTLAVERFIRKILQLKVPGRRRWITEKLGLHIPYAALMAAEAGDTLPKTLQDKVAKAFVVWSSSTLLEEWVHRVASQAAGTDLEPALAALWIEGLKDKSPTVRWGAARALGSIRSEAAVQPLLDALKDEDEDVRWSAAEALGSNRSELAVQSLLDALKDKDARVREAAADALGSIRSEAVVQPLLDALEDENLDVRWSVADALGSIRSEAAVQPFLRGLKDREESVRRGSARALGSIRSEAAVQPLLHALREKDEEMTVRWTAAQALGSICSEAAVQPLLDALKDEDNTVRWSAAEALGSIRSEAAVQPLLDALKDEDNTVRWFAADALGSIRSEAAVQPLLDALKDEDESVRRSATGALGSIRSELAVQPLLDALKDKDTSVRGAAADALGSIRPEAAVQPLLDALEDESADVRLRAARALGSIRPEAAVQPLLDALKNEDSWTRYVAAQTLGSIRLDATVQPFLEALNDEDEAVRRSAATALVQIAQAPSR